MEDSSNSQHSDHPTSSSDPAESGTPSDSGDSGGSAGDNSSSSMQWKSSSGYKPEDEEDMDVDVSVDTTSSWTATVSSAGKGKMLDTGATSSSSREGKKEEIGLLTDLYNLRNNTGRFTFSGRHAQRDFYKFWIDEERDYANKQELDEKINELHARFLKNMDKNVDGPVDPVDVEILRLSHWIWGNEIDSDDDDEEDLSAHETDSSQHETAKDSTKDIGGSKDSPSKANGKGSAAS